MTAAYVWTPSTKPYCAHSMVAYDDFSSVDELSDVVLELGVRYSVLTVKWRLADVVAHRNPATLHAAAMARAGESFCECMYAETLAIRAALSARRAAQFAFEIIRRREQAAGPTC